MICSPLKRKENFSEYQKCIRLILVDLFLGDYGAKISFSFDSLQLSDCFIRLIFVVWKCKEKQPGLSRHLPSPSLRSLSLPLVLRAISPLCSRSSSCCLQSHHFKFSVLIFFLRRRASRFFVWLLWEINYFIFILWALWFVFDPHPIFLSFLLIRGLL